jgi:hypothetical protein
MTIVPTIDNEARFLAPVIFWELSKARGWLRRQGFRKPAADAGGWWIQRDPGLKAFIEPTTQGAFIVHLAELEAAQ